MSAGVPFLLVYEVQSGELVERIDMPVESDPNYGIHWLQMHPTICNLV